MAKSQSSTTDLIDKALRLSDEIGDHRAKAQDHLDGEAIAKRELERTNRLLQVAIAQGKGTGDRIRDIKTIVWDNFLKDRTYDNLRALDRSLSQHPDELVLYSLCGSWRATLGILTARPGLTCDMPSVFGEGEDARLLSAGSGYGMPQVNIPVAIGIMVDVDEAAQTNDSIILNRSDIEQGNLSIAIGDKAVQAHLKTLDGNDAYKLWIVSRKLGHPLRTVKVLDDEIHRRREKCTIALLKHTCRLDDCISRFEKLQKEPQNARRAHSTPTTKGVELHFPEADEIEEALEKLVAYVAEGTELGMTVANEAYKDAVRLMADAIVRWPIS